MGLMRGRRRCHAPVAVWLNPSILVTIIGHVTILLFVDIPALCCPDVQTFCHEGSSSTISGDSGRTSEGELQRFGYRRSPCRGPKRARRNLVFENIHWLPPHISFGPEAENFQDYCKFQKDRSVDSELNAWYSSHRSNGMQPCGGQCASSPNRGCSNFNPGAASGRMCRLFPQSSQAVRVTQLACMP